MDGALGTAPPAEGKGTAGALGRAAWGVVGGDACGAGGNRGVLGIWDRLWSGGGWSGAFTPGTLTWPSAAATAQPQLTAVIATMARGRLGRRRCAVERC